MSIKPDAQNIIENLPEDATWDDLVKELYRNHKITLGMTDLEVVQKELNDNDLNAIIGRLKSSSSRPDDMRNTKTYEPGNAATMGMLAGVIAIVFSLVFPPISWIAAAVAFVSGGIGIARQEEKAWVPVLLALVSMVPIINIILEHGQM